MTGMGVFYSSLRGIAEAIREMDFQFVISRIAFRFFRAVIHTELICRFAPRNNVIDYDE